MSRANVEAVKFLVLVQNMDRAIAFYRRSLNLVIRYRSAAWSELGFGEAIIALRAGGLQDPRRTSLSFQVSDINEACAAVVAAGGGVLHRPERSGSEPLILANAVDTEGNEFRIAQYV